MTKDEALHKALKVLNCLNNDRVYETAWVKGAINACEEALEQPKNTQPLDEVIEEFMKDPAMKQAMDKARETAEQSSLVQEPMIIKQDNGMVLKLGYDDLPNGTPFYTHPKEWQGLSDEEILDIKVKAGLGNWYDFSHAIEAKLKEKNT